MKSKTEIMNGLNRTFGRAGLKLKKYSPEILVGVGIVGTVTSAVMACKATLKVNEVVEEHNINIEKIHVAAETGVTEAGKEYTAEDCKKDLTIAYIQTGVKLAKNYAPAITIGTLSIASILTGHNIMRKRYIATAAAYSIIDKSFKDYRGRVVERFGKELDEELRYNIKAKEVDEIVVNEDGSESAVKTTVQVPSIDDYSDYAKFFCEGCDGWTKNAEHNLYFLKCQQNFLNERLRIKGHVFLNEAYDALGMDRTKAGNIVGWIYDEKNPVGDNFIDFGLSNPDRERTRAFVNGWEPRILIDFNVDGNILDLIER
jgi:hypothetical protein